MQDPLSNHSLNWLAADRLDNPTEVQKINVGVANLTVKGTVHPLLTEKGPLQLLRAQLVTVRDIAADPGSMGQQVTDRRPGIPKFGQVLLNRVIDCNFLLLDQHHNHRHRPQHLSEGGEVILHIRCQYFRNGPGLGEPPGLPNTLLALKKQVVDSGNNPVISQCIQLGHRFGKMLHSYSLLK